MMMRAAALAALAMAAAESAACEVRAEGVSEAEYLSVRPPMPRGVRATRGADGAAVVTWDAPPPPPSGPVAYQRRVLRYRIYRGRPGAERLLGEATGRRFVDPAPQAGAGYVVTAVHGDGAESGRPDPATLAP